MIAIISVFNNFQPHHKALFVVHGYFQNIFKIFSKYFQNISKYFQSILKIFSTEKKGREKQDELRSKNNFAGITSNRAFSFEHW